MTSVNIEVTKPFSGHSNNEMSKEGSKVMEEVKMDEWINKTSYVGVRCVFITVTVITKVP